MFQIVLRIPVFVGYLIVFSAVYTVLWPLGYLLFKGLASALLVVVRLVPIPALTYIYAFYLDVRKHHARSKSDFRDKIVNIEEEIEEHEALGEL